MHFVECAWRAICSATLNVVATFSNQVTDGLALGTTNTKPTNNKKSNMNISKARALVEACLGDAEIEERYRQADTVSRSSYGVWPGTARRISAA